MSVKPRSSARTILCHFCEKENNMIAVENNLLQRRMIYLIYRLPTWLSVSLNTKPSLPVFYPSRRFFNNLRSPFFLLDGFGVSPVWIIRSSLLGPNPSSNSTGSAASTTKRCGTSEDKILSGCIRGCIWCFFSCAHFRYSFRARLMLGMLKIKRVCEKLSSTGRFY